MDRWPGLRRGRPEDLLGAIIDICADSRDLATIFDRDPTALALIDEQLPRSSQELTEQTLAALAGPDPGHAGLIRANAALAVAKAATIAAIDLGGGTLSQDDRAEVLAVALRTLKGLSRPALARCHVPLTKARAVAEQWRRSQGLVGDDR